MADALYESFSGRPDTEGTSVFLCCAILNFFSVLGEARESGVCAAATLPSATRLPTMRDETHRPGRRRHGRRQSSMLLGIRSFSYTDGTKATWVVGGNNIGCFCGTRGHFATAEEFAARTGHQGDP